MEMQQIAEFLGGLATKEVVTVFAAIAALFMGWKACKGVKSLAVSTFNTAASFSKTVGAIGLLATTLFVGGLGTMGLGIGELASWEEPAQSLNDFSTEQLLTLARDPDVSQEKSKEILAYVATRNSSGFTNDQLIELHKQNSLQIAQFVAEQKQKGVELSGDQIEALVKANSLDSILNHVNNRDNKDLVNYNDGHIADIAFTSADGGSYPISTTNLTVEDLQEANLNSQRWPLSGSWATLFLGIGLAIVGMIVYVVNDQNNSSSRPELNV